jgi:phospholipid/cholesterol/gamma-HCH transport system substrate-binding protein
MNKRSIQIKVGLLVVISSLILGSFIFILGNYSFGKGFTIYVDFQFIGNLSKGAPVKISGIKMGRVESIEFHGGKFDPKVKRRVFVRLKIWIEEKGRDVVRTDSKIYINTQGILGEQYVEIEPGNQDSSKSKILKSTDPPLLGESPPRADLVVARLYTFLDQITKLLISEKGTIKKTLKQSSITLETVTTMLKENRVEIKNVLKNGNVLVLNVNKTVDTTNSILGDGKKVTQTLNTTNYLISSLSGKLPLLLDDASNSLRKVNKVTSLFGQTEKDKIFNSLNKVNNLTRQLDLLTKESRTLLKGINKGKGSVGALISKREVYEDLKELIRDLRENPWKLFWKD